MPDLKLGNCVATSLPPLPRPVSAYPSFVCKVVLESPDPTLGLSLPYISEFPPTFRSLTAGTGEWTGERELFDAEAVEQIIPLPASLGIALAGLLQTGVADEELG